MDAGAQGSAYPGPTALTNTRAGRAASDVQADPSANPHADLDSQAKAVAYSGACRHPGSQTHGATDTHDGSHTHRWRSVSTHHYGGFPGHAYCHCHSPALAHG
ncbi:MAG: hypothetical protein HYY01_01195 [Chloroflexi bacterium]|nr:hypothetical protein [Chloroflexota bacterium]